MILAENHYHDALNNRNLPIAETQIFNWLVQARGTVKALTPEVVRERIHILRKFHPSRSGFTKARQAILLFLTVRILLSRAFLEPEKQQQFRRFHCSLPF